MKIKQLSSLTKWTAIKRIFYFSFLSLITSGCVSVHFPVMKLELYNVSICMYSAEWITITTVEMVFFGSSLYVHLFHSYIV